MGLVSKVPRIPNPDPGKTNQWECFLFCQVKGLAADPLRKCFTG